MLWLQELQAQHMYALLLLTYLILPPVSLKLFQVHGLLRLLVLLLFPNLNLPDNFLPFFSPIR